MQYEYTTLSEGVQCELGPESLRNNSITQDSEEEVQCELGQDTYRNYVSLFKVKHTRSGFQTSLQNGGLGLSHCKQEMPCIVNCNETIIPSKRDCPSQPQYKCKNCNKSFSVLEYLEQHCLAHHKGTTSFNGIEFCELVCGDCGLQYPNSSTYEIHCMTHNPDEPYKCIECSLRFKKCLHLEEHRASHLLVKQYSCTDCGKEYSFKWSLLMHSQLHGFRPQHQCVTCGLFFLDDKFLSSHEFLHSVLGYTQDVGLLKSINILDVPLQLCKIHKDQVFPCPMCEEDRNKECSKMASTTSLECEDCDLEFPSEDDLSRHLKFHKSPHSFKCDLCDEIYLNYNELKDHVHSSHSDYEVHWCENCGGSGYMNVPVSSPESWLILGEDDDWSSTIIDKVEVIHKSPDPDYDREQFCKRGSVTLAHEEPANDKVVNNQRLLL